jgi:hypothetical protein
MIVNRRLCASLLASMLLAGCAGTGGPQRGRDPETQPAPPPPPVNLSGYNATFKQGYADGCASAGGTARRNEARYKSEMDYQMGWNDGNAVCGKRR